jgi:hypothetical protein
MDARISGRSWHFHNFRKRCVNRDGGASTAGRRSRADERLGCRRPLDGNEHDTDLAECRAIRQIGIGSAARAVRGRSWRARVCRGGRPGTAMADTPAGAYTYLSDAFIISSFTSNRSTAGNRIFGRHSDRKCRFGQRPHPSLFPKGAGLSHMSIFVVSTGARSAERRDLLSPISCLSWREGLSTRDGACPERSRGALGRDDGILYTR